jgi:epoxyqueuosine reductase
MTARPEGADLQRYADDLRATGVRAGLDRVGITTAEPFDATRTVLETRKEAGLHGGMQFTYRNPARSTDPARALASVRTLVVGALAYPTEIEATAPLDGHGPLARVARYATADHYASLRAGLEAMAAQLRADGYDARVLLDDNALVDRAAAVRAGLGWFGKNANVLLDGTGSWFVLGSVLTDAPLPGHDRPVADGCGGCTRCVDGCPTGAIVAAGVVDARRCLAWLVQAEGVFPREHRVALGDRIYGCDVCQEVCPPSTRSRREGVGGSGQRAADTDDGAGRHAGTWVPILELLASDDEELLGRFGRWYIPRREVRYLRRNALLALANAAPVPIDAPVTRALEQALDDGDPVIRGHAVWAVRRLGALDLLAQRPHLLDDPAPEVRAEMAGEVPSRAGSTP